MIRHFLTIAYRNLLRRKVYTLINVTGLAVGMACCMLICYYVLHELSYDKYNKNAGRTYRVVHAFRDSKAKLPPPAPEEYQVWGNAPVGPALLADFPEIDKLMQFTSPNTLLLQYGDKRYQESNLLFMDSTAFDIFSWKMLEGDPHKALVLPNSIVLTKTIAEKYFGREKAVGRSLKVENDKVFQVTGVMEDVPSNSHFNFNALISMTTFRLWRAEIYDWWGYVDFYTYFTLKPGTNIGSLTSKIPEFLKRRNQDKGYAISFEKLTDAYLHSKAARQPGVTGSLSNVYIFSSVALFILIIACINFINLSTARSMERAKEVGVRKVLGANMGGLVRQFLSESVLLSIIAAIIAVILAQLGLPLLAEISGKTFASASFFTWGVMLLVMLFSFLIGLLSGIYPALFLSRLGTMRVLRSSKFTGSGGISLRKALVIFQFTLSMALIAATGIVYSQLQHLRSHDLGFKQDQMLVINFGGDFNVQQKLGAIKNVYRKNPAVLSVTASRAVPGEFIPNAYTQIQGPDGQMKNGGPLLYEIDDDFIQAYQIKMPAGRPYSREFLTDSTKSLIINEAAAKAFGYSNPADVVGKRFSQWGREGTVIGLVKDFNFRSLHQAVEPLALRFGELGSFGRLSLRIKAGNIQETITQLKRTWDEISPERPFLYSFLDESFSRQYEADLHFGEVFTLFAGLAIFISCLGLFGLATFTGEQRTKEIGIRKVLGSSVAGIVTLISKDFLKLVLISIVIAVPLCWYVMNQWLNDFPYRITISPLIFLKSGIIAILIAVLTISWQSISAAVANPIDSLRDE